MKTESANRTMKLFKSGMVHTFVTFFLCQEVSALSIDTLKLYKKWLVRLLITSMLPVEKHIKISGLSGN